MSLPELYNLQQVAESLGMSERWLRQKCADGAAHTRLGHKIRFTDEQVKALVTDHMATPRRRSITTGRKQRSA